MDINFSNINYFIKPSGIFIDHPMCRCTITPVINTIKRYRLISYSLTQDYIKESRGSLN